MQGTAQDNAGNTASLSVVSGATSYTYDAAGLRVKKITGSTSTVYVFSGTKVIAEYEHGASAASPKREYLYLGSQLLSTLEWFQSLFHQVLCCNPHVAPNLNPLHAKDMAAQNGHRLRRILANLSLAQIPPRFANFTPVPP